MGKNKYIIICKRTFFYVFLLIFILLFFSSNINAWWDGNWPLKQQINISTSSGTTPQNYSVEIILNSSNVGSAFDWNNECSNNQTRVRFVDQTDLNELNFWVKSCDSISNNMTVWVKIDQNITSTG